jgi:hypothetical protein
VLDITCAGPSGVAPQPSVVCNSGWLHTTAMYGLRQLLADCLMDVFDALYSKQANPTETKTFSCMLSFIAVESGDTSRGGSTVQGTSHAWHGKDLH